jgi:hypothetical protein
MTLEEVGNWQGNMLEIGPLYPWVGSEGIMVLLGVAFWIIWHIWQFRMENRNYEDDLKTLKQNDNMSKALKGEKILRPM